LPGVRGVGVKECIREMMGQGVTAASDGPLQIGMDWSWLGHGFEPRIRLTRPGRFWITMMRFAGLRCTITKVRPSGAIS